MEKSDHEKIVEKARNADRLLLVDTYMQLAIDASRNADPENEYGFLNIRGHEVPDPTVVEPPLGYIQQPDLMEQMRRMVRHEMSRIADDAELETFEEADDFDIDDDPVDYESPYEMYFDPSGGEAGPPAPPTHPARADPNAPVTPPAPAQEPAQASPPASPLLPS